MFLRATRGGTAEERLRGKIVMLDNAKTQTEQGKQDARLRRQLLRKRPRIGKEGRKEEAEAPLRQGRGRYDDYLPLHEAWDQYMRGLLESGMKTPVEQRVMMADLHGAILTVSESKCGSDVGLSGIVIRESSSAFHLMTQKRDLVGRVRAGWEARTPIRQCSCAYLCLGDECRQSECHITRKTCHLPVQKSYH